MTIHQTYVFHLLISVWKDGRLFGNGFSSLGGQRFSVYVSSSRALPGSRRVQTKPVGCMVGDCIRPLLFEQNVFGQFSFPLTVVIF